MSAWQPIETAPRDGTHFFGIVDGERRILSWGKTSHVPIYGFCLSDQGPEDFDLCDPALWHAFPALPSSEEQSSSRRCEATCAGKEELDEPSSSPQPSDATELVERLRRSAAWRIEHRVGAAHGHVTADDMLAAADFITQAQARATAAESLLETARKVLTETQRIACGDWCNPGKHTPECDRASSFLSSLSHQDEQG